MLILLSLNTSFAGREATVLSRSIKSFENTDCKRSDSCTLDKFELNIKNYKIKVAADWFYGTKTMMSYNTKSIDDLEEYAIVQFMRGCYFSADKVNGNKVKNFEFSKKSFDAYVVNRTLEWGIDSIDKDPIYNSPTDGDLSKRRHHHYQWNEIKDSFSKKTRHQFGTSRPQRARLYVKDVPSASMKDSKSDYTWNSSYEFKTCIYKTKDIPETTTVDDLNFAKPIHCFDWESSFIYNYKKMKMEKIPATIKSCDF